MFENKVLVSLYVVSLDKKIEVYLPINEKVGNVLMLLKRSLFETNVDRTIVLLNLRSGNVYKNNDLVRDTDIKNGAKLILVW